MTTDPDDKTIQDVVAALDGTRYCFICKEQTIPLNKLLVGFRDKFICSKCCTVYNSIQSLK